MFKLNCDCYYTDTDSIFTNTNLSDEFVGTELGMMKDELNGLIINKAIFLGIKQYGYQYQDNKQIINKSVFAGVTRDSLTFEQIEQLSQGKILIISNKTTFYKSLVSLDITIRSTTLTIKENDKKSFNANTNTYIPIHLIYKDKSNKSFLKSIMKVILRNLKLLIRLF